MMSMGSSIFDELNVIQLLSASFIVQYIKCILLWMVSLLDYAHSRVVSEAQPPSLTTGQCTDHIWRWQGSWVVPAHKSKADNPKFNNNKFSISKLTS